jgi:hypothetical protein
MLFIPVAVGSAVALIIAVLCFFFAPGPDKAYVSWPSIGSERLETHPSQSSDIYLVLFISVLIAPWL